MSEKMTNEEKDVRYGILARYYYYAGTYGAPENGFVKNPHTGNYITFPSVREVENFIINGGYFPPTIKISDKEFRTDIDCYAYGQYADNHYHIRKIPDSWLK